MDHAKAVMSHPGYRYKSKNGRKRFVHLTVKHSSKTVYGHTWNEAFRRASLALITERLSR